MLICKDLLCHMQKGTSKSSYSLFSLAAHFCLLPLFPVDNESIKYKIKNLFIEERYSAMRIYSTTCKFVLFCLPPLMPMSFSSLAISLFSASI